MIGKSLGLNVMCAVTAEQGKRLESLQACGNFRHGREYGGVAIDASNASNSAIQHYQLTKAKEYAIEGSKSYGRVVPTLAQSHSFIYLRKGPSMVEAFKGLYEAQMVGTSSSFSKTTRCRGDFAQILLLAGEMINP